MILDTPTPETLLSSSLLLEDTMSVPRKKSLFVAAASITVLALIQSPSAQNSGTAGTGKNLPPAAVSAAADKKAVDAMSNQTTSAPTDADRKAAATMGAPPDPAK
jgi:hypothetical protein